MLDDLFYYQYPFYIPNFFHQKLSKDQFRVRFKFYQIFSSINIEKEFFLKENPKEALELIKYDAKVSQHIVWEDRFEIASVMEDFLSKKINAHEFHDSVFGLRRKHSEKCERFLSKLISEEIKDFCPNKNAHKLKGFLSALYFECEHFETNFDKAELYTSIENGLFEIYLN